MPSTAALPVGLDHIRRRLQRMAERHRHRTATPQRQRAHQYRGFQQQLSHRITVLPDNVAIGDRSVVSEDRGQNLAEGQCAPETSNLPQRIESVFEFAVGGWR